MAAIEYRTSPLGVKYIKIARYDANGNDNYVSLRELKKIRIRTNDRGIIEYPVTTITEYPTYFLYQTVTTNITSSTNNQILNYRVSASRTTPQYIGRTGTGLSPKYTQVSNYSEFIDLLNYFNNSTGDYILGNTPNIPLSYTASLIFTGSISSADYSPSIALIRYNPTTDPEPIVINSVTTGSSASGLSGGNGVISVSGSFVPIENDKYYIGLSNIYEGTLNALPYTASLVDFKITQSQSPVAGIGAQTVLEPYITTPFINSDYDVLMNNAVENQSSNTYLKVDYVDNPNVPQNLTSILAGSTAPATIQDSNYTLAGYINSRYIGKGLTSRQLNKWTAGDISGNEKIPNVSILKTYFGEFNWLAGTAPEWGGINDGKTQTSLRYIVDENGTKLSPIDDEEKINLDIVDRTFTDSSVVVQLANPNAFGTNMDSLNGTFSIFKAGKRIKPIIYTQVANYDSNGNTTSYTYTGSLTFMQGGIPNNTSGIGVNDYRMVTFVPSLNNYSSTFFPNRVFEIIDDDITGYELYPFSSYPKVIKFNPPIQLGQSASFATSLAGINPSTGSIYKPTGSLAQLSGSGYILYLESFLQVNSNFRNTVGNGITIFFSLEKSTDGIYWTRIGSTWNAYFPGNQLSFSTNYYLRYTDYSATTSSYYRVSAVNRSSGISSGYGVIQVADSSYFAITQLPSPGMGNVTQFWATSSAAGSKNLLFAKTGSSVSNAGLNSVWGQKQQNIDQSGFDPIVLDFIPQPYDEIRFEGTETQTYTITQVSQSLFNGSNVLTLVLDRSITSNINTDYFLLRRYVDEVGNIIINTTKPAGGTSDGVIIPEFVTNNVKEVSRDVLRLLRSPQQN